MIGAPRRTAAGLAASLCIGIGASASAAEFTGLGDLPGGIFFSQAFDVSDDGSVVVGEGRSASGREAFRWTSESGMVGLGDFSGGSFLSMALGVSDDGSVVVGIGSSTSGFEAFRWTSGGGMAGLGDLPGGDFSSAARGVSGDGLVVVGESDSGAGIFEAMRWTSGGGMVGLGLPAGFFFSQAWGVSDDGSVVVGRTDSASGNEAFRWTSGAGMVGLGDLPGGGFGSDARGVSGDGSVIVGATRSEASNPGFGTPCDLGGIEAFRWTSGGGMVGLGTLPGGVVLLEECPPLEFRGRAFAASGDGSVIVGKGFTASGDRAFIWDSTHGMRSLRGVLDSLGLGPVLSGWKLVWAQGISEDGLSIVGRGINPSGQEEAWIAVIPPTTLVPVFAPQYFAPLLLAGLVMVGAFVLVTRVRRRGAKRR